MVLRYRLYGKEGVQDREYTKLINMGVVQQREPNDAELSLRYKTQQEFNEMRSDNPEQERQKEDLRRIRDELATKKYYQDNSVGDHHQVN